MLTKEELREIILEEITKSNLEEGWLDRLRAKTSGLGAKAGQLGKNVGHLGRAAKAGLGGDSDAAKSAIGQVASPAKAGQQARNKKLLDLYGKHFQKVLTKMHKDVQAFDDPELRSNAVEAMKNINNSIRSLKGIKGPDTSTDIDPPMDPELSPDDPSKFSSSSPSPVAPEPPVSKSSVEPEIPVQSAPPAPSPIPSVEDDEEIDVDLGDLGPESEPEVPAPAPKPAAPAPKVPEPKAAAPAPKPAAPAPKPAAPAPKPAAPAPKPAAPAPKPAAPAPKPATPASAPAGSEDEAEAKANEVWLNTAPGEDLKVPKNTPMKWYKDMEAAEKIYMIDPDKPRHDGYYAVHDDEVEGNDVVDPGDLDQEDLDARDQMMKDMDLPGKNKKSSAQEPGTETSPDAPPAAPKKARGSKRAEDVPDFGGRDKGERAPGGRRPPVLHTALKTSKPGQELDLSKYLSKTPIAVQRAKDQGWIEPTENPAIFKVLKEFDLEETFGPMDEGQKEMKLSSSCPADIVEKLKNLGYVS